MRSSFLPFSRPSITDADIQAVTEVLRSGWITTGPKNAELEGKFAAYTGAKGAVALSSATAGMHVLLQAIGIAPGDEVITPSMTWVSTVNLITLCGARPVFADIERDTLMVSAQTIRDCISDRTRMIIPVHFAGAAVDLDPLRQMASARNIFLAEDAAHAAGTEYKGEKIGRRGTAIFSFHPIKNMTTGEGGLVCSDDPALLDRIRRLKFHGLGVDAFDRHTQGRAPQAEVLEPGYKYNLPDLLAALGISQLRRLDQFNRKRSDLAALYREKLADIDEIWPLAPPSSGCVHSHHLFIIRLDIEKAGMNRNQFMEELKHHQIGTGLHFQAVHLQKYYQEKMGLRRGMLPQTEWNSDRICSLPLFPDMTPADVTDVVHAIKKVLTQ